MYLQLRNFSKTMMLAAVVVCCAVPSAQAIDDLTLNVAPGSESVAPGDTVTVTLNVANLSEAINGVQALISYDPGLLTLTGITPTDLGLLSPAEGWVEVFFSDVSGDLTYAIVINGDATILDGTVATLTFTAIAEGVTTVGFRPDADPLFSKLTASIDNAAIFPVTADSGTITLSCDDGLACTLDTLIGSVCDHTVESAGVECRASTDLCDPAETCDGVSGACPTDVLELVGTLCRAAVDLCDVVETCDGVSASCPSDGVQASGTVCGPSTGLCDPEETCDGVSVTCPTDLLESAGTVCRGSAGLCDLEETCDGTLGVCPVDMLTAAGTVCRASVDLCDAEDACDGVSALCPADALQPNGAVCRASVGLCDPEETCDGVVASCPAEVIEVAGAVCRAAVDVCDLEETCDGVTGFCPTDVLETAGTICRASTGLCDTEEACDGVSGFCPGDALEPDGTLCSDGTFCNGLETCDGAGTCQPATDPCTPLACDEVNDTCLSPVHIGNLEVFYAGRLLDQADPSRFFMAPGSIADVSNITNYAFGITGIRITFDNLVTFAATPDAAFSYRWTEGIGTQFAPIDNPGGTVTATPFDGGGFTVVDIVIVNDHVRQRWLEVTVDAVQITSSGSPLDGELTGNPLLLPSGDGTSGGNAVFYIGNMPGEVTGDRKDTLTDVGQIRLRVNPAFAVPIDNIYDIDKSGKIQLTDVGLARLSVNPAFALPLIAP